MVEEKLESEVIQILEVINSKQNFLLSGGAGSGKTYSLISLINKLMEDNPNCKIACITYTNASAKEIQDRTEINKIEISTIHDFIWKNISNFKKEMKETLIELCNDQNSDLYIEGGLVLEDDIEIQYLEYRILKSGIISHDEVLTLGNKMFEKYIKLCDIFQSKYDFIFVDEYQDTSKYVIEILLEKINRNNIKTIIGLFGDQMQSIYDDGIGDVNKYIESNAIIEIQKKQNRRNPLKIINLANGIRIDNLKQKQSEDVNAPNMDNGIIKQGIIKFLYSKNPIDYNNIKNNKIFSDWDFKDYKKTKELRLTHSLIACGNGFENLLDSYDKDIGVKIVSTIKQKIKDEILTITDENESLSSIFDRTEWKIITRGPNAGKTEKEVFMNDDNFNFFYNICKDKPFAQFKKIYFDKDNLISGGKINPIEEASKLSSLDSLIKHIYKIIELIKFYTDKRYNDFIKKTNFKLKKVTDKQLLKNKMDILIDSSITIEEAIDLCDKENIVKKDDKFNKFVSENDYQYKKISKIKFCEAISLYNYIEGYLPFATQHKIKGLEFNNILVILDNGRWNNYNFSLIFETKSDTRVFKRTKKIFYVCCTRAKEKLYVLYPEAKENIINQAKEYFGAENIICIDV